MLGVMLLSVWCNTAKWYNTSCVEDNEGPSDNTLAVQTGKQLKRIE